MTTNHYIQTDPICIFARDENETLRVSELHFHGDYKKLTFDEFCLYVIVPRVEELAAEGYNVKRGYVNVINSPISEAREYLENVNSN